MAGRAEAIQALGVAEDEPGSYDHKAALPGAAPPLQAALDRQAWLSGIDWRYGLRCGLDGHQCRVCRGIPCRGSGGWQETGAPGMRQR